MKELPPFEPPVATAPARKKGQNAGSVESLHEHDDFFKYCLENDLPKGVSVKDDADSKIKGIDFNVLKNLALWWYLQGKDIEELRPIYNAKGWNFDDLKGWYNSAKQGTITEINGGELRLWVRKYLPDKENEFFKNDLKESNVFGVIESIMDAWENNKDTAILLHEFFILVNIAPDLKRKYYLRLLAKKCGEPPADMVKRYKDWVRQNSNKEAQVPNNVPTPELAFLKSPDLVQKLKEQLDKSISGEDENKTASIVVVGGGRLVQNISPTSMNLLINGTTGAGKDFFVGKLLNIFPKELVIKRSRVSPTALNYLHAKEREPNWTWDRKILYLEDISATIFNHEVFKVLTSNRGGTCTITIDGEAKDITQVGKPVVICTAARLIMQEEMERRFRLLTLDESEDATRLIVEKMAESEQDGDFGECDPVMVNAQKYLKACRVHIPFGKLIPYALPNANIAWRTISKVWFDYIKCSTALHQYQRSTNEQGELVATAEDYELGTKVFLSTLQNIHGLPLTRRAKNILEGIQRACAKIEPEEGSTIKRVHAVVSEIQKEVSEIKIYEVLAGLDKFTEKTLVKVEGAKQKVMAYRVRDEHSAKPSLPSTYDELIKIAKNRLKVRKDGKDGSVGKDGKVGGLIKEPFPPFPPFPPFTVPLEPQKTIKFALVKRDFVSYLTCEWCQKSPTQYELEGKPLCSACFVDIEHLRQSGLIEVV